MCSLLLVSSLACDLSGLFDLGIAQCKQVNHPVHCIWQTIGDQDLFDAHTLCFCQTVPSFQSH